MSQAKQKLAELLKSKGKLQYLDRAWGAVKNAAFCDRPEQELAGHFSEQAMPSILDIVAMYEAEVEAGMEAEAKRNEAINEFNAAHVFDDEEYDELTTYIVVYSDRIEFIANENGYGDKIPKYQRKYIGRQGDRRWMYPLSELGAVKPFAQMVFNEKGERI